MKKCWPAIVGDDCHGSLHQLFEFSESPESFLKSISAWNHLSQDNPEYRWQVLMSHVSASSFCSGEISCFTICIGHKVKTFGLNYQLKMKIQDLMTNRFSSKNKLNRNCFLCSSKSGLRMVTFSLHKKCFHSFSKVVPIGAGIYFWILEKAFWSTRKRLVVSKFGLNTHHNTNFFLVTSFTCGSLQANGLHFTYYHYLARDLP